MEASVDPGRRAWGVAPGLAWTCAVAVVAWLLAQVVPLFGAPVLAILGEEDEYSTPTQVDLIRTHLPAGTGFRPLLLPGCGHAPHRDLPGPVLEEVRKFLAAL